MSSGAASSSEAAKPPWAGAALRWEPSLPSAAAVLPLARSPAWAPASSAESPAAGGASVRVQIPTSMMLVPPLTPCPACSSARAAAAMQVAL